MSLINKMLQDLESRRATLAGDSGMPHEIRSLPPQRATLSWTRIAGATLLAFLAGAAAWWFLAAGRPAALPAAAPISAPATAPAAIAPVAPPIAPVPMAATETQSPAMSTTDTRAATSTPETTAGTSTPETTAGTSTPETKAGTGPAVLPQPVGAAPAAQPAATVAQSAPAPVVPPEAAKAPPSPPQPSPPAQAKPAPVSSVPASKGSPAPRKPLEGSETGLKVATALGKTPSAATPAADEGARIEKKMRASTPRERAENEYRRALGLVNQGRVQEGIAVLRGALSEDAGHAGSRLALFGLLVEQQRFEEAQALLEETLARDPAQPQMASRLARLKLARGDARGAEETLGRTAASALDNPEYRALHAAVLQRLTFHRKAVAEYQAALRLVPQAGVWWMGLGISLEAEGSLPEARDAFQRARATGALTPELAEFVEQRLKRLP